MISNKCTKLMRIIRRTGWYFPKDSTYSEELQYLLRLGYVEQQYDQTEHMMPINFRYRLTTSGRSCLDERCLQFKHKWITIAISVLALMKSYGLGLDDIAIYCMRLSAR